MELTIVGCSGSYPGADSAASSYLVTAEGFTMVVDLGTGSLGSLQRYADLSAVDAVCLSHLHGDHCMDMCSYRVFRSLGPGGPLGRIPVYGPAGSAERLGRATAVRADEDGTAAMARAFEFAALSPGRLEIGPFAMTVAHTNHPVETFAFRLEHGGRAIAYSADTGPCEALVSLAAGADVLLCEASFTDQAILGENVHLTARQAAEHATRAGVGRLVLTHLVPWNSRQDVLDQAADAFEGDLSLASPGMSL